MIRAKALLYCPLTHLTSLVPVLKCQIIDKDLSAVTLHLFLLLPVILIAAFTRLARRNSRQRMASFSGSPLLASQYMRR